MTIRSACKRFCTTLVTLSLFLIPMSASYAQDVADEAIEEIVVRGIKYSQQQAIGMKRDAVGIMDAISANDMGRLPDKNAAESVDRLPGVSISTDQGEGRFVIIRGISPSLNNLTINGQSAGTPEAGGGRAAPLDVIGGDLLQSIEVIKSPTPDMDGQGIGGTINVITPSVFSKEEQRFGSLTLSAGYEDFSDNTPYAATFSFGGKNSDDTVGFLIGGSYSYRDFVARGVFQDDFRSLEGEGEDGSSTDEWVPENSKNTHYNLERTRAALNVALEFKPSDSSLYHIRGYYSQFDETEERQRYEHFFSRNPFNLDGATGDSEGNRREQDLRLEEKDKSFANIAIGGENSFGNAWTTDYGLQFNSNETQEPNRNWEFRGSNYGTVDDPDSWIIDGRGIAVLTSGDQDVLDPNLIEFRRLRNQDNSTTEEALIAYVNFQKDMEFGSMPGFIKFGAKHTGTERDNDASRLRYNLGDVDWTMGDFGHAGESSPNEVDGYLFPMIFIDGDAANAFFDENVDNLDYFEPDEDDNFTEEFESDYLIDETITAAYAMMSLDTSDTTNFVFGVRVEQTDVDSTGYRRDEDTLTAEPMTDKGDYTTWLPGVTFRWNASDQLVVRAAVTTAIGRPGYDEIANISNFFSEDIDGDFVGAIDVGNPNLEPHESVNVDLSVEYYTENGGLLAGAVFYKDIDNFIFDYSERCNTITGNDTSCEFEGVSYDAFTYSSIDNAESAKLTGVEFNYQQTLDFLDGWAGGIGFGVSAAYVDSEMQLPDRDFKQTLLEQPEWTASFMVFYQTAQFEATLAIDNSAFYLDDINGDDGSEDIFKQGYGRLDFKMSYDFTDKFNAFFEWQNINDEPLEEFQGGVKAWNTQIETYGQTMTLGVRANF
jgi:TonB-dependent receptor